MTDSHDRHSLVVSGSEVERRMCFADAALGAAGHEVADPTLRELSRQVAAGTITAEEAIARGVAHIDATQVESEMSLPGKSTGSVGPEATDL
jgi:hypothetical protein